MKKTILGTISALLLSSVVLTAQAGVVCKASMMGRICFDEDGKELTVAEMQAATAAAELKDGAQKIAKK